MNLPRSPAPRIPRAGHYSIPVGWRWYHSRGLRWAAIAVAAGAGAGVVSLLLGLLEGLATRLPT
jgi:hypothetical protein